MPGRAFIQPRRALPHTWPPWVHDNAVYMLTVCCTPRYRNQLCRSDVFPDLRRCLQLHDDRGEWELVAAVAMPDHLHVLARVPAGAPLGRMVTALKRLTARRHGVAWQRDFFEHRLRSADHVEVKREYLRQNPVRAGLVESPEEWPYFWSAW
jgi:putative transposase